MEIFLLPEAERDVQVLPAEMRPRVESMMTTFEIAETYWSIARRRHTCEVVTSLDMRKWRVGGNYRALFDVRRSEATRTNYILLWRIVPHEEYMDILADPKTSQDRLARSVANSRLEEFLADLDARQAPVSPQVPRDYVGLAQPLIPLIMPEGPLMVSESSAWVESVLSPLIESSRSAQVLTDGRLNSLAHAVVSVKEPGVKLESLATVITAIDGEILLQILDDDAVTDNTRVRRRYPLPTGENAVDEWIAIARSSEAKADPYLVLDEQQKRFLDVFTRQVGALPACIDGPGGSGKTTALLLLLRGFLQNARMYSPGSTAKLITASENLTQDSREALRNHLVLVDGWALDDASATSIEVCVTVDKYLLGLLPAEASFRFNSIDQKVTWPKFLRWYEHEVASFGTRLTAHEAWCALRILITGDRDGRDDPLREVDRTAYDNHVLEWFRSLNHERQRGMSESIVVESLKIVSSYQEWKATNSLWDDSELVDAALDAISEGNYFAADFLIVDEAQDLTPDCIRAIVRSAACVNMQLDSLAYATDGSAREVALPMLFAADDLQTINPSGFQWASFLASFFQETKTLLNTRQGLKVVPHTLDTNYRLSEKVNSIAHSLRRSMKPEIPVAPPATIRPAGFSGPIDIKNADLCRKALASASRVIIPGDEIDRDRLLRDDPLVAEMFSDEPGRVVPAVNTKGREFRSVVLYGFAKYLRDARQGLESSYARQITYVAASRARDAAVWMDPQTDAQEWFWKDTEDERSPARHFSMVEYFGGEELAEFAETEEEVLREARRTLLEALTNSELDFKVREGMAAEARARFRQVNNDEFARDADYVLRLLQGDPSIGDINQLSAHLQPYGMSMAEELELWRVFQGGNLPSATPQYLLGCLVNAYVSGDVSSAVRIGLELGTRSEVPVDKVSIFVRAAIRGVVAFLDEHLVDVVALATESSVASALLGLLRFLDDLDEDAPGRGIIARAMAYQVDGNPGGALRALATLPADDIRRRRIERAIFRAECGIPWLNDEELPLIEISVNDDDERAIGKMKDLGRALWSSPKVVDRFLAELPGSGENLSPEALSVLVTNASLRLKNALSTNPSKQGEL